VFGSNDGGLSGGRWREVLRMISVLERRSESSRNRVHLAPDSPTPDIYRDAAKLSPDGRFLAYVSDESGRREVWVSRFPQGGPKWQVTRNGGTQPRWSRDGKELFYVQRDTLFSVTVSLNPTFSMHGTTRLFYRAGLYWRYSHATYDVAMDGKKFVVIEPVGSVPPLSIRVVQNWFAEFSGKQR
jgi:serine/threonine-protein kinase